MKHKVIKTEIEYEKACARIYELMHSTASDIEANSPEGEELQLLSLLVEQYEQERYRLSAPDPISAIKFRMEQMGLRNIDVAPLFGGKTRVSEVLHGKRPLTLKMITLLNRYLGIPLESLMVGNKEVKLDPKKREMLLRIDAINKYAKLSHA